MLTLLLVAAVAAPAFTFVDRDQVIVGRVPVQIERYRSTLAPAQAVAAWGPDTSDPQIAGAWSIANRQRGPEWETLQAREARGGGSELILSRIDFRKPLAASARVPFALPAGATVMRTLRFEGAQRASVFVVSLPRRPAGVVGSLCARVQAGGWRAPHGGGCEHGAGLARWFVRGGATLAIDLRPHGRGARAVIAFSESPP